MKPITVFVALTAFIAGIGVAHAAPKDVALLQGLEKVTARVSTFEVPINQSHRFGSLDVYVRACDKTPPEETPEATVFLEIYDQKIGEEPVPIFSGWMFSSSPAVSAIEHPVYDVWILDCKDASSEELSSEEAATSQSE